MLLKLNRTRKGATVLLACLVLSFHSFAQSYTFKHITTNDGLVQTDVTDIKQDKKKETSGLEPTEAYLFLMEKDLPITMIMTCCKVFA